MARIKGPKMPAVVIVARNRRIGELVEQCARGEITFGDLQREVAAMGFNTGALHEMVLQAERALGR